MLKQALTLPFYAFLQTWRPVMFTHTYVFNTPPVLPDYPGCVVPLFKPIQLTSRRILNGLKTVKWVSTWS